MIDTNKSQYAGQYSGFANKDIDVPFSASYAGGSLTAGHYAGPVRATVALDNSDDISSIKVKLTGLESFYRMLEGTFYKNFPNSASPSYQVELFSYYKGGLLYVDAYISNQSQTGSTVTVPAFTMDCLACLYQTPTRVG